MAFLAKLETTDPSLADDVPARRAHRWRVGVRSSLWTGRGKPLDVVVHNISATGFLAEFPSDLAIGEQVKLQLGDKGYAAARVVWKRGFGHGCEFYEPISQQSILATCASATRLHATDDGGEAAVRPGGRLKVSPVALAGGGASVVLVLLAMLLR